MTISLDSDKEASRVVPTVLIVGDGLGGLMTAILLDRLGFPFRLFPSSFRSQTARTIIALNASILALMEQLDLLRPILKFSLKCESLDLVSEDMDPLGSIEIRGNYEACGYDTLVFPRPKLYDLLFEEIPADKIHSPTKVVSIQEDAQGVVLQLADGTTHRGHVVVGSDGGHSKVRELMYQKIRSKLPISDTKPVVPGFVTISGITGSLDPEKYPVLRDPVGRYKHVISASKPFYWTVATLANNRICWGVGKQLDSKGVEALSTPEGAKEIGFEYNSLGKYYSLACPFGGTMGELIHITPLESVTQLLMEEKLFETWHSGRIVLIGDACHKMLANGGLGSVNAMQDAVVLVNCLNDLESLSIASVTEAFQEFKKQRFERAHAQTKGSRAIATLMSGQTWKHRLVRSVLFNYVPSSFQRMSLSKTVALSPSGQFLALGS